MNPSTTDRIRRHLVSLRSASTRLGITQELMARLLGVSSLSIWKWASGGATPRASWVPKILQLLALGIREALSRLAAQEP